MRGNFRGEPAVIFDAQQAVVGDVTHHHRVQSPLLEYVEHLALAALFRDQEHAFLRFAEHDFVRGHARLTLRHFGEVDLDAGSAARGHFRRGTGQARRAHVLNGHYRAGLHGFETCFQQELLHERVADLHIGALLLRFFGELGAGQERCAVNAVAPRLCADVNHGIAGAAGFGEKQIFFSGNAQGQRVYQRILRVARFESDFAADRGDSEAVSVMGDAANYAVEDAAIGGENVWRLGIVLAEMGRSMLRPYKAGLCDRAETEGIQDRYGAGAHGENVAENAAYTGGRALERLDVTGMVVRLD